MRQPFIFLGNGKVNYVSPAREVFPLESRYAEDLRAKALKAQERHGWKSDDKAGGFLSSGMLWGKAAGAEPIAIQFTSLAAGRTGDEFLYTLKTDHLCAICSVRGEAAEEQRLWNHHSKRVAHLNTHPTLGHIACSAETGNGAAHIAVWMANDGSFGDVTEGDAFDTAPSWAPGEKMVIVFQSAGIGRNKEGHYVGLGPFALHRLDVESGELTTLAEDESVDFLTPRVAEDGTVYYIRRPYTGNARASGWDHAKDIVLFPFRFARAVFGFMNFFSMMYSGKQLKTVKSGDAKNAPLPQMMLWGNLIKAQQPDDENPNQNLVPKTWQLARRAPGRAEEILATSVACFDLARDGTILYSNGSRITERSANGKEEIVAKGEFIQQVAFLKNR